MPGPKKSSATTQSDPRVRIPVQRLPLWDLTDHPLANHRFSKIGSGLALRGAAVEKFNERSGRRKFADGLVGTAEEERAKQSSRYSADVLVEPDNWALRFHQEGGRKNLSTWALRLIADSTTSCSSRENRGTMVVDQALGQTWAWLHDLLRIVNFKAGVDHEELAFNGAAFLGMLYPDGRGGGLMTRGCAALNISKRAYFSDGGDSGPPWHIFAFDGGGGAAKPGAGQTVAEPRQKPGQTAAAGASAPSSRKAFGLRADVRFISNQGNFMVTPLLAGPKDTEGKECTGYLYLANDPAPLKPKDLADDSLSNQPITQMANASSLRVFVKVPQMPVIPEKQPPGPNSPKHPSEPVVQQAMPPAKHDGTIFSEISQFKAGELNQIECVLQVPDAMKNASAAAAANSGMVVMMDAAIGSAYGKGESSIIDVGMKTATNCDAGGPSAASWSSMTITSADGMHTNNFKRIEKKIPGTTLVGKDNIPIWISMRSTSTGPPVIMKNPHAEMRDGITAESLGFAS